ncbi:MAG: hypothetical protein OCC49_15095 [Fibrobacterales bacterium]
MADHNKNQKKATVTSSLKMGEYEKIYNEDIELIRAVTRDKYYAPLFSIDIYLEEAEGYLAVINRRMEQLKAEGFKDKHLDTFYRRIASARTAQANMATHHTTEEDGLSWDVLFPEAEKLRKRLLKRIKLVCKGNPQKAMIVKNISSGNRISDTIQDLFELAKLGETVMDGLLEYNVHADELYRAKELVSILGRLHKENTLNKGVHSDSRMIRDKALTLLNDSNVIIKEYADLAFGDDKKIMDEFRSAHSRQKNKSNGVPKTVKPTSDNSIDEEESEAV